MEWSTATYKRKKQTNKPRKLIDSFSPARQDGRRSEEEAGRFLGSYARVNTLSLQDSPLNAQVPSPSAPVCPSACSLSPHQSGLLPPNSEPSPPVSPDFRSPVKSKIRLEDPEIRFTNQLGNPNSEIGRKSDGFQFQYPNSSSRERIEQLFSTPKLNTEESDPILNFPTTDQPITQTFFKEFMLSFRDSIQTEIRTLTVQMTRFAMDTNARMEKIEAKISDVTVAHNDMVDAHEDLIEEVRWLKEKLVDAEDRNRRNNIKIRGVPESIPTDGLKQYVKDVIKKTIPNIPESELVIDRAHRLPKPNFLPERVPRDVITRIHFFHVKEAFLASTRRGQKLPAPFQDLSLFSDLSQVTLQIRREFIPITSALRSCNIPYRWGFPTKLLIHRQGTLFVIKSVKEGMDLLHQWNIQPFNPNLKRSTYPAIGYAPTNRPSDTSHGGNNSGDNRHGMNQIGEEISQKTDNPPASSIASADHT